MLIRVLSKYSVLLPAVYDIPASSVNWSSFTQYTSGCTESFLGLQKYNNYCLRWGLQLSGRAHVSTCLAHVIPFGSNTKNTAIKIVFTYIYLCHLLILYHEVAAWNKCVLTFHLEKVCHARNGLVSTNQMRFWFLLIRETKKQTNKKILSHMALWIEFERCIIFSFCD